MLTYLVDKHAQQTIEYLKEENKILYQKLGRKRLILTDQERRRLAVKAKPLGRRLLAETTTSFSADTILGWCRKLVGQKYDGSKNRKGGRPKVSKEIVDLVLRFKKENPQWGYDRIQGYIVYFDASVNLYDWNEISTSPPKTALSLFLYYNITLLICPFSTVKKM